MGFFLMMKMKINHEGWHIRTLIQLPSNSDWNLSATQFDTEMNQNKKVLNFCY